MCKAAAALALILPGIVCAQSSDGYPLYAEGVKLAHQLDTQFPLDRLGRGYQPLKDGAGTIIDTYCNVYTYDLCNRLSVPILNSTANAIANYFADPRQGGAAGWFAVGENDAQRLANQGWIAASVPAHLEAAVQAKTIHWSRPWALAVCGQLAQLRSAT